ncbi:hypothetical protein V6U77_22855 [Micromonospora sp. CPCC 205546]
MSQQKRIETALDIVVRRQKELDRLTAELRKVQGGWKYDYLFPLSY